MTSLHRSALAVAFCAMFTAPACVIDTVPLPGTEDNAGGGGGGGTGGTGNLGAMADAAGGDARDGRLNGDTVPPPGDDYLPPPGDYPPGSPRVTGVTGNGPNADGGRNTMRDGLIITGENLDGAAVSLDVAQLTVLSNAVDRIEAQLPAIITAGQYSLTVTTAQGTDVVDIMLVRGVPGSTEGCP